MGDDVREWQRAYEWDVLARDVLGKEVARAIVRRPVHDLYDHIQIVELASGELGRRAGTSPEVMEMVGDLETAVASLKAIVKQLSAAAADGVDASTEVAAPCRAAIARLGAEVALDLHAPTARVRGTAEDVEHLVAGVLLAAPASALLVRERTVDGAPWLELLCTASAPPPDGSHDIRIADAIATRLGGELSISEARGGGSELVVALPCV